jgi:hypothetical protein
MAASNGRATERPFQSHEGRQTLQATRAGHARGVGAIQASAVRISAIAFA